MTQKTICLDGLKPTKQRGPGLGRFIARAWATFGEWTSTRSAKAVLADMDKRFTNQCMDELFLALLRTSDDHVSLRAEDGWSRCTFMAYWNAQLRGSGVIQWIRDPKGSVTPYHHGKEGMPAVAEFLRIPESHAWELFQPLAQWELDWLILNPHDEYRGAKQDRAMALRRVDRYREGYWPVSEGKL